MSGAIGIVDAEDFQELRLALVMNGGVSLAVWMGGVTHEINRLIRSTDAYGEALRLTASTARVDVISGTSAGGINGALLGLAVAHDADLHSVRSLWMDRGAIDALMRGPLDKDPQSVLAGETFLTALKEAFAQIKDSGASLVSVEQAPIELTLTTTLLNGEHRQLIDDLGIPIQDVVHRGRFQFRRGPDLGRDDFRDRIDERLALAARATASFPVAFEPQFCPVSDAAHGLDLPDMKDYASFGKSKFLLDGGILDNKPLEAAIEAVFRQRAEREVRRVLAYVVPNPGQTAAAVADDVKAAPSIGRVALASMMELQGVESISDQLNGVLDHNRKVRRKKDSRLALTFTLDADKIHQLANALYPVYRHRRMHSAFDYIVAEVAQGVLDSRTGTPFGRRHRERLIDILTRLPQFPWIPTAASFNEALESVEADFWGWGAITVEDFIASTLDLLRLTLSLTPARDESDREIRRALRALRRQAYDYASLAPLLRLRDRDYWRANGPKIVKEENVGRATERAQQLLNEWARRELDRQTVAAHAPRALAFIGDAASIGVARLMRIAVYGLAQLIRNAAPLVRATTARRQSSNRLSEREAAERLRNHIDFLCPERDTAIRYIVANLLALEVVQFSFPSDRDVQEQYVELVQISANVASAYGGARTVAAKLAGAQLANFGGFYKKVWRANDWMYGRLDGAERLSRILLHPPRLMKLYGGMGAGALDAVMDELHRICVGASAAEFGRFLETHWRAKEADIRAELDFLNDPNSFVPEVLPHCATALARRVQLEILQEEMPNVTVLAEQECAADKRVDTACANLLAAVKREREARRVPGGAPTPPESLVQLLLELRIGGERIASEIGTDRFTRTATRTLSVAIATLASESSGFGGFRRVFQALRVPTLALDGLSHLLVGMSRTSAVLFAAALSISLTLIAVDHLAGATFPDWLANIAVVVVFGAAIAALLRFWQKWAIRWTVLVLALALGAYLATADWGKSPEPTEASRASPSSSE